MYYVIYTLTGCPIKSYQTLQEAEEEARRCTELIRRVFGSDPDPAKFFKVVHGDTNVRGESTTETCKNKEEQ